MFRLTRFLIFLLIPFVSSSVSLALDIQLGVYYGTTLSVKEREKVLKSSLPGDSLAVFARSRDFEQALKILPIPVIIAPSFFDSVNSEYEPVLQLAARGKNTFQYKVVALKNHAGFSLSKGTLGLIEEVERKKMKELMEERVGLEVNRINTVSKPEDLFPLLVFGAADAIAVSEDNYIQLLKHFTAPAAPLSIETKAIPYPRVFIRKGAASPLLEKLEHLNAAHLKGLGFDKIERIKK